VLCVEQFDKYYIDVESRDLLDDELALKRLDAGDETVRHIGSLLLETDFSYQPVNDELAAEPHTWTREDLLQLGHWVTRAGQEESTRSAQPDYRLQRSHVERLQVLGLAPSVYQMRKHFGTWEHYREALLEYPDVQHWEVHDYIQWGVRAMEANGCDIDADIIDELAKDKRGPTADDVRAVFGGNLGTFNHHVKDAYDLQLEQEHARKQSVLVQYEILHYAGILPEMADEAEQLLVTAKYELAEACLPGKTVDTYARIALASDAAVMAYIKRKDRNNAALTPAKIEMVASMYGLFDYVWPQKRHMEYLKVPKEKRVGARDASSTASYDEVLPPIAA
jgi:hypothetical protein